MRDDETGRSGWDAGPTRPPEAAPHPAYTTPQPAAAAIGGPGVEQRQDPAAEQMQEEKTWSMVAHLSALSGLIVPLGSILGPLIVWTVGKDKGPFINDQGKEALNFQIAVLIALIITGAVMMAGVVLSLILVGIPILILGAVAFAVVSIGSIVFAIIGAMKANEGQWYRYPYTMRLVK